ncbi:MAG: 4Fe-4S binding protein [Chloroflexi bacterium]|nr:4Fe-4S binding protein [Chloroflexota bacterium]
MAILKSKPGVDRKQLLRYAWMVLGILALAPPFGFLAQAFGSSTICGNLCIRMAIGSSFVRELFSRTWGVILLFLWLGTTLFFGRWFCSHFCPVGALTEFGSKLLPPRLKIDYARAVNTPLFRYGFLGAYLILPMVGFANICCSYCNFSTVPEFFGAFFKPEMWLMVFTGYRMVSVLLFVFVLGIIATDGRGHCHLLCPVGAVDSIFNILGARLPFTFRERIDLSKCGGCGICEKECPAAAITVDKQAAEIARIDYRRCYQCRICEGKCARKAISIRRL